MSAVMKLVKEYEKRRQLWDKSDDHYHSHESKNSTWAAIANVFSCSSHDVRKKFRSVLASYRRERAKVRDGHRSTWFLYPHLRFLPQYVHSPGDSEETVPEQYQETEALSNHSDDTHVSDEEQEIAVTIKEEPAIQVISPELYESSSNSKKKLTRTMKKRPQRKRNQYLVRTKIPVRMNQCRTNQTQSAPYQTEAEITYSKAYVDSKILELQKTLKTESLPRKDDCDTYGEYIASTLRKHDNKTQCRIKQAINNILFEEEMCKYDDPLKTGLQ